LRQSILHDGIISRQGVQRLNRQYHGDWRLWCAERGARVAYGYAGRWAL